MGFADAKAVLQRSVQSGNRTSRFYSTDWARPSRRMIQRVQAALAAAARGSPRRTLEIHSDARPAADRDCVDEGSPDFLGSGSIVGQRRAAPCLRGVLRRRHRPPPARDDRHTHERNPNAEVRRRKAPSARQFQAESLGTDVDDGGRLAVDEGIEPLDRFSWRAPDRPVLHEGHRHEARQVLRARSVSSDTSLARPSPWLGDRLHRQ